MSLYIKYIFLYISLFIFFKMLRYKLIEFICEMPMWFYSYFFYLFRVSILYFTWCLYWINRVKLLFSILIWQLPRVWCDCFIECNLFSHFEMFPILFFHYFLHASAIWTEADVQISLFCGFTPRGSDTELSN